MLSELWAILPTERIRIKPWSRLFPLCNGCCVVVVVVAAAVLRETEPEDWNNYEMVDHHFVFYYFMYGFCVKINILKGRLSFIFTRKSLLTNLIACVHMQWNLLLLIYLCNPLFVYSRIRAHAIKLVAFHIVFYTPFFLHACVHMQSNKRHPIGYS